MSESRVILITEGNRKINRLISFILFREGYETISAYDGRAARKVLGKNRVDGVIIDTLLPYPDGIQLLKQIRRNAPDLPVVMLSVKIREADRQLSISLGANDFIKKPFALDELVRRLKKALGE